MIFFLLSSTSSLLILHRLFVSYYAYQEIALLVTVTSRSSRLSEVGGSLSELNQSAMSQSISYVGSGSNVCVWPWNCSLRIRTVSETYSRHAAASRSVSVLSPFPATCITYTEILRVSSIMPNSGIYPQN